MMVEIASGFHRPRASIPHAGSWRVISSKSPAGQVQEGGHQVPGLRGGMLGSRVLTPRKKPGKLPRVLTPLGFSPPGHKLLGSSRMLTDRRWLHTEKKENTKSDFKGGERRRREMESLLRRVLETCPRTSVLGF